MVADTPPGIVVGSGAGPFDSTLSTEHLRRFAAATGDPSPSALAGTVVPAVAIVTQIWDAQDRGRGVVVPEALQRSAKGGVHGEHDIVLHRPIQPDEPLRTWVEGYGARPAGRNSLVTLHYVTLDAEDRPVAEQWWTTVYLGVTCAVTGAEPPEHDFPAQARAHPAGTYSIEVDADMARRYAEVSGDWSEHHFTVDAARESGFDRPFLHGLCTMALCAQAVVTLVADGAPARIRRIAVRFANPLFIGEHIDVHVFAAGERQWAFEGESRGAPIVSNGLVELW